MTYGDGTHAMEIVGVAGAVKHFGLDTDERPAFYIPLAQDPWTGVSFVVRTAGANPLAIVPAARASLREIDPALPIAHPNAMAEMVRRSFWQRTIVGEIFGVFSIIATALAAAGIAGAMAYMVVQRRQEIGVRMALGAQAGDVQRLVLGRGMRLAAIGLAIGAAASLAFGRLIGALLFGVAGADPLTLGGSLLIFGAVALAACWIPARRAARVDPMTALRAE
jgi:putative ABC transport system permease protein